MITELLIYWITRLDAISITAQLVLFVSIILLVVLGIFIVHETDEEYLNALKKNFTFNLLILTISTLVCVFVPTTKEMAVIKILPYMANSEMAQEIPEDMKLLKNMAMDKIKSYLKED